MLTSQQFTALATAIANMATRIMQNAGLRPEDVVNAILAKIADDATAAQGTATDKLLSPKGGRELFNALLANELSLAPETLNTLREITEVVGQNQGNVATLLASIGNLSTFMVSHGLKDTIVFNDAGNVAFISNNPQDLITKETGLYKGICLASALGITPEHLTIKYAFVEINIAVDPVSPTDRIIYRTIKYLDRVFLQQGSTTGGKTTYDPRGEQATEKDLVTLINTLTQSFQDIADAP